MRSPCPEQIFLEFSTYFGWKDFSLYQVKILTQKVDFLCRFDLWFVEVYHKAEFLNLMDDFFCVELTLVSGICSKQPVVQVLVNSSSARLKNEPLLQSTWTIAVQSPTAMAVLWTDTFVCLHGNIANGENLGVWARERMHLSGLSKLAILLLWPSFRISLLSPFKIWN